MFTTHYLTVSPPVSESLRMTAGLGNTIISGRRESPGGKERKGRGPDHMYTILCITF